MTRNLQLAKTQIETCLTKHIPRMIDSTALQPCVFEAVLSGAAEEIAQGLSEWGRAGDGPDAEETLRKIAAVIATNCGDTDAVEEIAAILEE